MIRVTLLYIGLWFLLFSTLVLIIIVVVGGGGGVESSPRIISYDCFRNGNVRRCTKTFRTGIQTNLSPLLLA